MTITMIDSASAMQRILDSPEGERAGLVREMWAPLAGMYRFAPGEVDLAEAHRGVSGFPWDRDLDETRRSLDALVRADAWARMETALAAGLEAIHRADPGAVLPDIHVLLIVADSRDEHLVREVGGLSAFGGISGSILLVLHPTPEVLARLEAIAVHELHHNVRYSPGGVVWDPARVTVGEQVVAEGLADAFASELHGALGPTHFVAEATRRDDAVLALVASGLGTRGMGGLLAWVLGDASAERLGIPPVGLPTGAGYAVGLRLVRAYLDVTGLTAAASVRASSAEVIRVATERLGLPHPLPATGAGPSLGEDGAR
ncbi:DUF2268 domain-containing protein [Clavibacter capsici]|uniref:Peptidase n=1 Tax=Clavibacter capsici TaxID=1874630 RepID=A0AAE7CD59_9MICO|nr:DUF2268 domain-containing putative Zn-dependent protease [Clavibacter capsici]ALD13873.1 peptidase [Clavibacter capsici]QIS46109.1 peptidase [Clavibacter capsici]